jgi:glycerol-3-phosphate acyltransferase PlsY
VNEVLERDRRENRVNNTIPTKINAAIPTTAVVGALLIVFAHRENVGRLVKGRESKFR